MTCILYSLSVLLCCLNLSVSGNSRYFSNVVNRVHGQAEIHNETTGSMTKIHFASYYENHMVLQQAPQRAVIWGYASEANATVELHLEGKFYKTRSIMGQFDIPIWRITLDPVKEHGPFDITAFSMGDIITLHDVLFGDVWLCSGQSNMQFTVGMSFNGAEEIANASHYPDIRLFTVKRIYSQTPLYDLNSDDILQHWSVASKESVGGPGFAYFSAVCWMYGRYLHEILKYPIGLIASSYGGTIVEAWSSPESLEKCNITNIDVKPSSRYNFGNSKPTDNLGPNNKSVLWNAMIHPLLNLTIYGTLWYQGESNSVAPNSYGCTFPAMIDDWRKKFFEGTKGETSALFPFGFVQIGPDQADFTLDDGFPDIRWHQTADYGYAPNERMKRTFMAVDIDLPDFKSPYAPIHTRDKTDVAKRLLLGGLAIAYYQNLTYQGPFPKAYHINSSSSTIQIVFNLYGKSKIEVRSHNGFEICCSYEAPYKCSNGTSWWLPSVILSNDDDSVTISTETCSAAVGQIAGIRYLWRKTPCPFKMCAVYDDDLPAVPFVSYDPWSL